MSSPSYWNNEARKVGDTNELFGSSLSSSILIQKQNEQKTLFDLIGGNDSTHYFDSNLNSNNSLTFGSVQEFKQFINKEPEIEMGNTVAQSQKMAWFKFNLIYIGGVIFYVKQEIGGSYSVLNVSSAEYGVSITFSWAQSDYDVNISGSTASINIYGKMTYNLIIQGIGSVFSQPAQFLVKTRTTDGEEIGGKKIL